MIGPRNDFGGKDGQSGGIKSPGEFVEQAGAIPSDDVDLGERAVHVVAPFDDGPK